MILAWSLLLAFGAIQRPVNGSISGIVRGVGGELKAGVRVAVLAVPEAGTPQADTATLVSIAGTDNEGRYRLENIPPGQYYITSGVVAVPTFYPGTLSPGSATIVTVTGGAALNGYNFTTIEPPVFTVKGQVVNASRIGIPSASGVVLSGPQQFQTSIGSNGSFEFRRVLRGTYSLSIFRDTASRDISVLVNVLDRDVDGVEIVLPKQVVLNGLVVTEDGSTLPDASISLKLASGGGYSVMGVPYGGRLTIYSLFEGREYEVSIDRLPTGYALKSIKLGNTDLGLGKLKLETSSQGGIVFTLSVPKANGRNLQN